jgi:hypothetical protein
MITANRFMVYGDCGIWFSLFNYKDASVGKIPIFNSKAQNSVVSCLNKSNKI